MFATRLLPKPQPDLVTITMTLGEAGVLRRLCQRNETVPIAAQANGGPSIPETRDLLRAFGVALDSAKVSPSPWDGPA